MTNDRYDPISLSSELESTKVQLSRAEHEREHLAKLLSEGDSQSRLTAVNQRIEGLEENLLRRLSATESLIKEFLKRIPKTNLQETGAARGPNVGTKRLEEHARIVAQFRDRVRAVTPPGAVVLVVGKGDEDLIALDSRSGRHFPQSAKGGYAGYHPAGDSEAIMHLEALRSGGAQFVAFPASSSWWLDHYLEFATYLKSRFTLVANDPQVATIYDLRTPSSPAPGRNPDSSGYPNLVRQMHGVVVSLLPEKSTVAVASRGDDRLLKFPGRTGLHFPQSESGTYAGYYPETDDEAIEMLESTRRIGAEFLVFPTTAFWWLDHYVGLREHLERRYSLVSRQKNVCLIYDLSAKTGERERESNE